MDKKKWERKNDIVLKGMRLDRIERKMKDEEKGRKKWVMKFLGEKVGLDCRVVNCRISRMVIIVKLRNEEKKRR